MKIVVIGTGLVASGLAALLRPGGHDVVAASAGADADTLTRRGLDTALAGASTVVDASTSLSPDEAAVHEFLWRPTRTLLAAAADAGVRHQVVLSVVGAARMRASSYMRAKVAQERLVESSGLPYSVVRATQLFEHLDRLLDGLTVDGVARAPSVLAQPMAAQDLVALLHEVALGPAFHGVVETGGPETFPLDELLRRVPTPGRESREVVTDPDARWSGARLHRRTLVPGLAADLGTTRLAEWQESSRSEARALRAIA
jgi:uncharacterized protein YbjT (DUF2867 family)